MNPPSTLGRHRLSTRFTSVVRIFYMSYTNHEQLQQITRIFLQPVIDYALPDHKTWSLTKNIAKLAATIVEIYTNTARKFTTDLYQHYVFTPRDISRLLISLSRHIFISNDDHELVEILFYEFQRIFLDKLVGSDSKVKFINILSTALKNDWSYQTNPADTLFVTVKNAFSSTRTGNIRQLNRIDQKDYDCQVKKQLMTYERDVRDLDVPIFPELLDQIARIERILGQSGGSVLLAGRPGILYPSIVALAANSLGYKIKTPKVSRTYTHSSFLADIKEALHLAITEGEDVVFLLEDFQVLFPSFLEHINTLLSGSDVSGIYAPDELGIGR